MNGTKVVPPVSGYMAAVNAFRARFPEIKEYVAYNEVNYDGDWNNRIGISYDPARAAQYFVALQRACATSCRVAAGSFLDTDNMHYDIGTSGALKRDAFRQGVQYGASNYLDAYKAELARQGSTPEYWAFHPYRAAKYGDKILDPGGPAAQAAYSNLDAFIKGTSPNGTAYTEGKNIWLTEAGPVVRMRNGTQTDDLERRSPAGAGGRFEQFLTRMTGKLEDGGTTERYKRVSRLYVYSYRGDTDCKRLNYENYVPKLDGKKVQCFDSGLVNFDFTPRPAYTTYKGYAGP